MIVTVDKLPAVHKKTSISSVMTEQARLGKDLQWEE
jgi:hypothetical protein